MDTMQNAGAEAAREQAIKADQKKLRALYIGLATYFLIMLNAARLATQVPYQLLVLGGAVNMAIIIAMVMAVVRIRKRIQRRVYRNMMTPTAD